MEGISKNFPVQQPQEDRDSRNSGSFQSEKIKMFDLTRDKPIKIAVRVAVPVKDHPKFNFVGKLLGPKGNSMKRLQEDTMCKMAVLGRGSMKDRKKEDELRTSGEPRYAHLAEDLHVEITTFAPPAEAHARIAYALAEVRRFLVPDYHDDIRQEQLWEMQALTTPSLSQSGAPNSPNSMVGIEPSNVESGSSSLKQLNEIPMNIQNTLYQNQKQTTSSTITSIGTSQVTTTVGMNEPTQDSINTNSLNNNNNNNCVLNNSYSNNQHLHVDLQAHQIHPSAVAAAIQQQITANMGMMKPPPTVTAISGIIPPQTGYGISNDMQSANQPLTLLEQPMLHPALRGIKSINFATAGNYTRKRPLLGMPRTSMNPTKRTVMTLLARAKNSQALHASFRNNNGSITTTLHEPLQMIASPMLLSHPHLHSQGINESLATTMVNAQKENLSEVV